MSLVFKLARIYSELLFIGMINYGITGNILLPPFSNKLYVPRIAKNLYGSIFSFI